MLGLTPSKIPFLVYILVLLSISRKMLGSNFLLSQQESGKLKKGHAQVFGCVLIRNNVVDDIDWLVLDTLVGEIDVHCPLSV
jgi:hypothetical protein